MAPGFKMFVVLALSCLMRSVSVIAQVDTSQTPVQVAIVNQHNLERSTVSPAASNMKRMQWDAEAARSAQRWADRCEYEHSSSRPHSQYGSCGENLAAASGSQPDWADHIQAWADEKHDYTYGQSDFNNGGRAIGHYTQMIWADSAYVGCGYKRCPGSSSPFGGGWFSTAEPWDYYVCHYCPPGNMNFASTPPYRRGSSCSSCPAGWTDCVDNLCSKPKPQTAPTTTPTTPKPTTPEPVVDTLPPIDCENASPDRWPNCGELQEAYKICTTVPQISSDCQRTCCEPEDPCASANPDIWPNCRELESQLEICSKEEYFDSFASKCETTCLCGSPGGLSGDDSRALPVSTGEMKRIFSKRFPPEAV